MEKIVKIEMKVGRGTNSWYEELDGFQGQPKPKTIEEAKKQANAILDFFNSNLRQGESKRKLFGFRITKKITEEISL